MRRKFDLCYMMAKEGIAFEKYVPLYELEARHDINLGPAYKTAPSAKLFTHYIAESQRQQFFQSLSETKFCSFLMDGSTDAGNIEQELVILLSCEKDDTAGMMKSYARFFSVATPEMADASGLVKCLSQSLSPLWIGDVLDQRSLLGSRRKASLSRRGNRRSISECRTAKRYEGDNAKCPSMACVGLVLCSSSRVSLQKCFHQPSFQRDRRNAAMPLLPLREVAEEDQGAGRDCRRFEGSIRASQEWQRTCSVAGLEVVTTNARHFSVWSIDTGRTSAT